MSTLTQYYLEHELPLPITPGSTVLGPRWFQHQVNIPNAATTAIDLRTGSILATDPMINARFNTPSDSPDYTAHVVAAHVVPFDDGWADLNLAEKEKTLEGIRMTCTMNSVPYAEPLGMHVQDAFADQFTDVDSDNTTLQIYGHANGAPLQLIQPWTLDLSNDSWKIEFNSVTQPAGPLKAWFRWFGVFAPNTISKAQIVKIGGHDIACPGGRISPLANARFSKGAIPMERLRLGRGLK